MAKIETKDEITDLDPTPSLRELAHALKVGTITCVPNVHAMNGYPILWVSLSDLKKIKKELEKKKEKSEAV